VILTYSNNSPKTDVSTLNGAGLSHLSEGFNFNKMEEIWKDVPDYKTLEASNTGRIRYKKNLKLLPVSIEKRRGYPRVTFSIGGNKGKTIKIHRLIAMSFIPNPQNKRTVNHIDGDKLNNCVSNLEWATDSENISHAFNTGLRKASQKLRDACSETCKKRVGDLHPRSIKVIKKSSGVIYNSITEAAKENGLRHQWVSVLIRRGGQNKYGLEKYKALTEYKTTSK
jgi:hypothetical protein